MFPNVRRKNEKTGRNFVCETCDFITSDKKDFGRHLLTRKHEKNINVPKCSGKTGKTEDDIKTEKKISCECGKLYTYRQSLNVHKKKCDIINKSINKSIIKEKKIEENDIDKDNYKQLILKMFEQLKEQNEQNNKLQNTLIEMIPKIGNNNNNIINNKLNIQIFLNENCKDAMNLGDFVNGIRIDVGDLMITKEKGTVEGLSNLLVTHLNKLPLYQRPLWCSDKKRKRLYIKEEIWKEDKDNLKTQEAIYNLSKLQSRNINKFILDKPNWINNDRQKEDYMQIVKAVTESMENKVDKVIDKLIDNIHFTEVVK